MAGVKAQRLERVNLNSDVYAVCLQHALSTEREEVMGLLIGEVSTLYHINTFLIYLSIFYYYTFFILFIYLLFIICN